MRALFVLQVDEYSLKERFEIKYSWCRQTDNRYHICLMRVLIILLSIRYNVCACLHTTTEECEKAYERIEYSLLTGSELASVGTGTPGSVGYMPSDPANYNEAVSRPDAELWKSSTGLIRPRVLPRFRPNSFSNGSSTMMVCLFA